MPRIFLLNGQIISSKEDKTSEVIKFEQLNIDLSNLTTTTIKKPKIQETSTLILLSCFFIKNKIVFFKQIMIYYKLNLYLAEFPWIGSKACKKSALKSPQWLRNIKDRNYPWWRLDAFFSKTKYSNINIFENGGWHFSYIKNPEGIERKLKSYLHHAEYEMNPIDKDKISKLKEEKKAIYNLKVDSRLNKFDEGNKLKKLDLSLLPQYVKDNISMFNDWIEK